MNTTKMVNTLWTELMESLESSKDETVTDFMRWDGLMLNRLIEDETKNERQHRAGNVGRSYPVSCLTAVRILLMHNVAQGAAAKSEPLAKLFIWWRPSAAMAWTVGYYLRANLSAEWLASASALDYAELMK